MKVIPYVPSTVPNKSLRLDFDLQFVPHISTEAIRTALEAKLFLCFTKGAVSQRP